MWSHRPAPPSSRESVSLALRLTAILCALLFMMIALGCMSFSFGTTEVVETVDCPPAPSEQPPNKQCGKLQLSEQQEVEVFYPVPFRYTPNLQVESPGNLAVVVDQKPDRFRIKHPYRGSTLDVSWQARGVPITAPVPTDAPLPIGPQPTPLPAPFLGQAQEETDQTTSSTEP